MILRSAAEDQSGVCSRPSTLDWVSTQTPDIRHSAVMLSTQTEVNRASIIGEIEKLLLTKHFERKIRKKDRIFTHLKG